MRTSTPKWHQLVYAKARPASCIEAVAEVVFVSAIENMKTDQF